MGLESAHDWVNSLTAADLEDLLGAERGHIWHVRAFWHDIRRVDAGRVLETFRERAAPGVPKGAHAKTRGSLGERKHRGDYMVEQTCVRLLQAAGLLFYDEEIRRLVVVIPPSNAYGNQFDKHGAPDGAEG